MKIIKTFILCLILCFVNQLVFAQVQIKMEKKGGIFYLPCKVNGLNLKFIFDTGASNVSISLSEAVFMLKNGYIEEEDLIGTERYQIANGNIAEGTILIIRELEIGNEKIYNVEASVVHSLSAPLLLGQSAIERFGSFSIDYHSNTLYLGGEPTTNNENLDNEKKDYEQIEVKDTLTSKVPAIIIDTCYLLPNSFTPNQDGINDILRPLNMCSDIISFDIEIINRWGETVFQTKNPEINWNGCNIINNEPLAEGLYTYYGFYTIRNNNGVTIKNTLPINAKIEGVLNLIR